MIPGIEDRIMGGSDEEIAHIGELVSRICVSQEILGAESRADTEGFF
jgi:hypothetical protein